MTTPKAYAASTYGARVAITRSLVMGACEHMIDTRATPAGTATARAEFTPVATSFKKQNLLPARTSAFHACHSLKGNRF